MWGNAEGWLSVFQFCFQFYGGSSYHCDELCCRPGLQLALCLIRDHYINQGAQTETSCGLCWHCRLNNITSILWSKETPPADQFWRKAAPFLDDPPDLCVWGETSFFTWFQIILNSCFCSISANMIPKQVGDLCTYVCIVLLDFFCTQRLDFTVVVKSYWPNCLKHFSCCKHISVAFSLHYTFNLYMVLNIVVLSSFMSQIGELRWVYYNNLCVLKGYTGPFCPWLIFTDFPTSPSGSQYVAAHLLNLVLPEVSSCKKEVLPSHCHQLTGLCYRKIWNNNNKKTTTGTDWRFFG